MKLRSALIPRRIAIAFNLLLASTPLADAMTFTRDHSTVRASGPIEAGDAAQFAALPKFNILELDSPGGLVGEALRMAANMDARGGIRTVVKPASSCASACAMVLFVSGETRVVYMGGRLGIHSCAMPDGSPAPECMWLGAEDAECWGLMRWSPGDTSNLGTACFMYSMFTNDKRMPPEVTAKNADDISCRMNAGTSRIYISTNRIEQGFSDAYRKACERVAIDPKSLKYAAIDIILWLTLTDPHILALKPATLTAQILGGEEDQGKNCWKCLTIVGMSELMNGYPKDGFVEKAKAEL
jgi:hypothetical protein